MTEAENAAKKKADAEDVEKSKASGWGKHSSIIVPMMTVLVASLISPFVMGLLANRTAQSDRRMEWARQDQVAANVAIAARQAEEAARLLKESNKVVAETTRITNGKLDQLESGQQQIHTLVNSTLTGAIESQATALEGQLTLMEQVNELNKAAGHRPTAEAMAALDSVKKKVTELRLTLKERAEQTRRAEQDRMRSTTRPK